MCKTMALIKCKDCNHKISEKACKCPKCGSVEPFNHNRECPECKKLIKTISDFCPECGYPNPFQNIGKQVVCNNSKSFNNKTIQVEGQEINTESEPLNNLSKTFEKVIDQSEVAPKNFQTTQVKDLKKSNITTNFYNNNRIKRRNKIVLKTIIIVFLCLIAACTIIRTMIAIPQYLDYQQKSYDSTAESQAHKFMSLAVNYYGELGIDSEIELNSNNLPPGFTPNNEIEIFGSIYQDREGGLCGTMTFSHKKSSTKFILNASSFNIERQEP